MKRSFKSHVLAINCIEVSEFDSSSSPSSIVGSPVQIVQDRLFSGSVDGSLKVWDISDLKEPTMKTSKSMPDERTLAENRSDVDSGIDDREYRERRAMNMV